MSIGTRRILYIIFILAFLIITPSLILYSMGYTIGNGFKLEKSGILVIETQPEGAKININNEAVQEFWNKIIKSDNKFVKTPAKIKNLKPGDYDVSVEIPGYWPWTKKLSIKSGQTTFAEDIFLFRNDEATLVQEFSGGQSSFSPNNEFFVNIGENEAVIIDLIKNKNEKFIFDTQNASSSPFSKGILWSSNGDKILSSQYIFDIKEWAKPSDIKNALGVDLTQFIWRHDSDYKILYMRNNKLFSYDSKSKNTEELTDASNVHAFQAEENDIFLISQTENKSALSYLRDGETKSELLLDLPYSEYEFKNQDHKYINLLDKKNKILYLVDKVSRVKPIKEAINDCEIMEWVDENTLLYSNGYEIWLYNLGIPEKKLLTRLSERIVDLKWHTSNNYILFATEKSINILELDNREKHNITKITDSINIQEMILDEEGEIVYFTSAENNNIKLYKILIQ